MNLAVERQYVADLLAGLDEFTEAYTYVPARTSLPAWLVTPAEPFITRGSTFGTATLHLDVTYISKTGANDVTQGELDAAISAAVTALVRDKANIGVESGTSPFSIRMNDQAYLAQTLTIQFQIDL